MADVTRFELQFVGLLLLIECLDDLESAVSHLRSDLVTEPQEQSNGRRQDINVEFTEACVVKLIDLQLVERDVILLLHRGDEASVTGRACLHLDVVSSLVKAYLVHCEGLSVVLWLSSLFESQIVGWVLQAVEAK